MNTTLLKTYLEIGIEIVRMKQLDLQSDDYKSKSITNLSRVLSEKFGKGFSRANAWNMIKLYENIKSFTLF